MNKSTKIALISVVSVTAIIGIVMLLTHVNEVKRQWCIDNPKECAKRAEDTRRYLESQRKKELNCGPTMPGYDQGWGGWRCKYEDD